MPSSNLSTPLRTALVGSGTITSFLSHYPNSTDWPIFSRRPAPKDAPFPMIMISGEITFEDLDGLNYLAPEITRDIGIYGRDDTADNYRAVEELSYAVRDLFHGKWNSIIITGWKVVKVTCRGPIRSPADDESNIGRVVSVTTLLAKHR